MSLVVDLVDLQQASIFVQVELNHFVVHKNRDTAEERKTTIRLNDSNIEEE